MDVLEDGKIYFTYHDQNTGLLSINKYDVLLNQWVLIQQINLTASNVYFVDNYASGNKLYVIWAVNNSLTEINIVKIDENEQLQNIVSNASSNVDAFQNSSIDFIVDEVNQVAYTTGKDVNSGVYVDMDFSDIGAQAAMTVTDISGKIVAQHEVLNGVNLLNLDHVNAGIYLVSIQDDHNSIVVRILKN